MTKKIAMTKKIIIFSVLLFIAGSCGQAPKKQAETATEKETLQTIDTVKNSGQYESFSLDSFPKEWVKLTMYENKYVIYQSCDAGNRQWRFSKNKDKYELLLYGEQEDYEFDIIKTYKVNDTIFVESRWKLSEKTVNFKVLWDKDNHLMRATNLWDAWDLFVEEKNVSNYEVYIQPCRECWGDECDEIEKSNEK